MSIELNELRAFCHNTGATFSLKLVMCDCVMVVVTSSSGEEEYRRTLDIINRLSVKYLVSYTLDMIMNVLDIIVGKVYATYNFDNKTTIKRTVNKAVHVEL